MFFGMSDEQKSQDIYAMGVLNLVNIARQIRAGRAEQLADEIENSLLEYLEQMVNFRETSLTRVTIYAASKLFRFSKKEVSGNVRQLLSSSSEKVQGDLSNDCYKLLSVCNGGKGCVPWPTSLRPVDVDTPDPMGWRY